ncbi:cobalamin B12-binding domain-containing protein [Pseudomonas monteilii]|uniref:cobalamin B12-binding domain-containing protein n=1 Tax=Pseudomonas monteilii TaxID=76759 RepID=UPI000761B7D5|nr:cobalamin B12-binding domain-containing protein [Pseudomonas monteilii]
MTAERFCLLATVESDSHMWNLVYLQLWLAERGWQVLNLGCCTPVQAVLDALDHHRHPHLLVISSVNGHGYSQGMALIRTLRQRHPHLHVVIGGKLTTSQAHTQKVGAELLAAGFDAVFTQADALDTFDRHLQKLNQHQHPLLLGTGTVPNWF